MWKEAKGKNATPITQNVFQMAFLYRFFSHEIREAKVEELMNLRQGSIFVKEYCLQFTQLFMYALQLLLDSSARKIKFVTTVFDLVVEE